MSGAVIDFESLIWKGSVNNIKGYIQKRITVRQALNQLRYKRPNDQLCIRTQTVLDRCLRFEGSRIVK